MATIGYAHLPVPAGGDSPTVAGDMAELATAIDPHLVHHVTDLAQRNEDFAAAPAQTIVVAADGSMWVKVGDTGNVWATLWEPDPAWRTLSLASGYSAGAYLPQVLRSGNRVWLRGQIVKSDDTVIPTNGVKVAEVPDDCIPDTIGAWAATSSLAGDVVIGVGKMEVVGKDTASTLGDPGSVTWWSQDGATAGGTPWINVSGSYWIN